MMDVATRFSPEWRRSTEFSLGDMRVAFRQAFALDPDRPRAMQAVRHAQEKFVTQWPECLKRLSLRYQTERKYRNKAVPTRHQLIQMLVLERCKSQEVQSMIHGLSYEDRLMYHFGILAHRALSHNISMAAVAFLRFVFKTTFSDVARLLRECFEDDELIVDDAGDKYVHDKSSNLRTEATRIRRSLDAQFGAAHLYLADETTASLKGDGFKFFKRMVGAFVPEGTEHVSFEGSRVRPSRKMLAANEDIECMHALMDPDCLEKTMKAGLLSMSLLGNQIGVKVPAEGRWSDGSRFQPPSLKLNDDDVQAIASRKNRKASFSEDGQLIIESRGEQLASFDSGRQHTVSLELSADGLRTLDFLDANGRTRLGTVILLPSSLLEGEEEWRVSLGKARKLRVSARLELGEDVDREHRFVVDVHYSPSPARSFSVLWLLPAVAAAILVSALVIFRGNQPLVYMVQERQSQRSSRTPVLTYPEPPDQEGDSSMAGRSSTNSATERDRVPSTQGGPSEQRKENGSSESPPRTEETPAGQRTPFSYDDSTRPKETSDPDGSVPTHGHDRRRGEAQTRGMSDTTVFSVSPDLHQERFEAILDSLASFGVVTVPRKTGLADASLVVQEVEDGLVEIRIQDGAGIVLARVLLHASESAVSSQEAREAVSGLMDQWRAGQRQSPVKTKPPEK